MFPVLVMTVEKTTVSVAGITGQQQAQQASIEANVARIKQATDLPVAVILAPLGIVAAVAAVLRRLDTPFGTGETAAAYDGWVRRVLRPALERIGQYVGDVVMLTWRMGRALRDAVRLRSRSRHRAFPRKR